MQHSERVPRPGGVFPLSRYRVAIDTDSTLRGEGVDRELHWEARSQVRVGHVCRRHSARRLAFLLSVAAALTRVGLTAAAQEPPPGPQETIEPGASPEESLQERERRLDELEQRLSEALERIEAQQPETGSESLPRATASEVMEDQPDAGLGRGQFVDSNFLKSVPLFGSHWRFSFGGYAKVDLLHDFSGTGNRNQFVLDSIPVAGAPPPGSYTTLHAKETRFNLEVRDTAPDQAPNRFFVEFDFFDESNSTSTRLRHAYFEYGNLLAGRTWTTLTELRSLAFVLDFAAGDSLYGGRTEQIRWQQDLGERVNWALALESYNDANVFDAGGAEGTARSDLPRLASRLGYESDGAVLTVGASLGQNRWDGDGGVGDVTELTWSLMAGGRLYLGEEQKDFLGFGASYGDGQPDNILTFANASVPNAVLNAAGELENIASWNANLGLHKEWPGQWSSNFLFATAELNPVSGLPTTTIETGTSFHINLIRQVSPRVRAGLEYMHGWRELVDGEDGTADRLQFSLIYYF